MFQKTQEDQLVILYRDYLFHLELNYLKLSSYILNHLLKVSLQYKDMLHQLLQN